MVHTYQNPLLITSSYLFCIFALIDPSNDIIGLKMPTFFFFIWGLILQGKPKPISVKIVLLLLLLNIIALGSGIFSGLEFDFDFTKQYFIFFATLLCLAYTSYVDFFRPLIFASIVLSLFTIFGFIVMSLYPEIENVLYNYMHEEHNDVVLMSHRTFLGVDFVSFCHKSLLVVTIPASLFYSKFLNEKKHKLQNLFLSVLFMFALFCGGNRSLLLGVFLILFILTYQYGKFNYIFKKIIIAIGILGLIIAFMALSEKGESSNDIKFNHLTSYINYFSDYFYLFFLGSGAGSKFYSLGFGRMTVLTEWTYLEIIRMYGIVGLILFLRLILNPIKNYKHKFRNITYWKPISLGYIMILIISGSNPYLLNSTGMICIVFMYSYIYNPKYRMPQMY